MGDSLKSNLTCPICLDLYTDPVALYCMHSFCRQCLLETVRNRAPFPGMSNDSKVRVPCPNCKREFPLSQDGVRNMQRNFHLQSIVEGFKRNQKESTSTDGGGSGPLCDICKEKESPEHRQATKRCTKCEVSYCPSCLDVYHPNRGPFATHEVDDIWASAAAPPRPGPKPAPKPRSAAVGPIKTQFRQDLDDLTKESDKIKRFVEELKQTKSTLETKTTDLKRSLGTECSKLRDYISKTENEQRGALLDDSKQKMMMVEIQLREHQEYLRKHEDLIDSLRALLKEPDDQLFLKTATSIKEKVKAGKGTKPRLTTPSNTDLRQSTQMLQDFKERGQLLMLGNANANAQTASPPKKASPPSPPPISAEVCISELDSIKICISPPVYVGNGMEAFKVDQYSYKYKKLSDADWKQGSAVSISQIESRGCIKIDSLTSSTQYSVAIRAHNSAGWSPWSTVITLKTKSPQAQKEPAPSSSSAARGAPRIDIDRTEIGSEIVFLTWNPSQGMEADAHIVAYCSDGGREDWIYLVTQEKENSLMVSGLSQGSAYLFKVGSCSKEGFSDWSKKVRIRLTAEQKVPPVPTTTRQIPPVPATTRTIQAQETSFALDKQTAHPCLLISGKTIIHPSNACPSLSDYFSDKCYSVFGNATFNSRNGGAYYWEVIIHGEGSKVRIGVAESGVNMSKPVGTCPDAWVLVMDARKPSHRQGSYVMYGNHMHKSRGQWIPFTNHIGVQLDFNQKEITFIEYKGPPMPTTPRTSHSFSFTPPDQLKPIFAIDEKTDDLKIQVVTDKKPPGL